MKTQSEVKLKTIGKIIEPLQLKIIINRMGTPSLRFYKEDEEGDRKYSSFVFFPLTLPRIVSCLCNFFNKMGRDEGEKEMRIHLTCILRNLINMSYLERK